MDRIKKVNIRTAMTSGIGAIVGGTIHGLTELPIVVPMEAAITQTQLNHKSFRYNLYNLYRKKYLYRSFNTTAFGLIPKCWIHYFLLNLYLQILVPSGELRSATFKQRTLCGLLTGASETIFLNPFNFVKFRMQRPEWQYTSMFDCIQRVTREEGILAFWKGYAAVCVRNSICMFGIIGSYNSIEKKLPKKVPFRNLVSGIISGCIGSFFSYPFEMIRAAQQHNIPVREEMFGKGIKRLMAGYLPGASRIILHSAALGIIIPKMTQISNVMMKIVQKKKLSQEITKETNTK